MNVNFSTQKIGVNPSFTSYGSTKTNFQTEAEKLQRVRNIYDDALNRKYALPAYNFSNMENLKSIVAAAKESNSPLIAQVSAGARKYAGQDYLVQMIAAAKKEAQTAGVPIMLHLDHGEDFEICKACIDGGFDSVMIDGSKHPLEENIALTKKVVEYAHSKGVFVEAELGKLAGVEDNVSSKSSLFTDPGEAARFVKETGCDSLAISIGTSHGPVKFRPDEDPKLDFARLAEIKKEVERVLPENRGKRPKDSDWRSYPFVLHGASSAPADLIADINANFVVPRDKAENFAQLLRSNCDLDFLQKKYDEIIDEHGKKVVGKGVPEDMYREAVKLGIAKVNVDTDFRLKYTATIKDLLAKKPQTVDPRDYGKLVQANLAQIGIRKMDMLNSAGKSLDLNV